MQLFYVSAINNLPDASTATAVRISLYYRVRRWAPITNTGAVQLAISRHRRYNSVSSHFPNAVVPPVGDKQITGASTATPPGWFSSAFVAEPPSPRPLVPPPATTVAV